MSVVIKRRMGFLPYQQVWFAQPPLGTFLRPVKYFQVAAALDLPGWKRETFITLLSQLNKDDEALLATFKSTVRNEVRQAQAQGLSFERVTDPAVFHGYYANFCAERGIGSTSLAKVRSLGVHSFFTQASQDGRVLAMHAYLVDKSIGRARLLWSASSRFGEEDKALVAKANRWLHYQDMRSLRDMDFQVYDWGGINPTSEDQGIQGINKFKQAFGGVEQHEYHYTPSWLFRFL